MINPYEHDDSPLDDARTFPCACGDETCIGRSDDAANINLNGVWYSADCKMAANHPEVVRMREVDSMNDVRRG